MEPSTDSQEGVRHFYRKSMGDGRKSEDDGWKIVRHCLEPSTDSQEGVGHF